MENQNKPINPNAFPATDTIANGVRYVPLQEGMSLLDYHASKFMQVYLKQHLEMLHSGGVGFTIKDMVESSYLIAKEMLTQREL